MLGDCGSSRTRTSCRPNFARRSRRWLAAAVGTNRGLAPYPRSSEAIGDFDDAAWVACDHGTRRHSRGHDGTGGDARALPDPHPLEHDRTNPDPDVVLDYDRV